MVYSIVVFQLLYVNPVCSVQLIVNSIGSLTGPGFLKLTISPFVALLNLNHRKINSDFDHHYLGSFMPVQNRPKQMYFTKERRLSFFLNGYRCFLGMYGEDMDVSSVGVSIF